MIWNQWNMDAEAKFREKVRVNPSNGCHEWTGTLKQNGYGFVTQNGKRLLAHRAAMINAGYDVEGWHVLHKCNNRKCVNPEHLYLGTHEENMEDMAADGSKKGERHHNCQLSDADVMRCFELRYVERKRVKDIAALYGLSPKYVSALLSGKKRAHQTAKLLIQYGDAA